MLEKVTAFITRKTPDGIEALLLLHPYAGYQFVAGTCEYMETPEVAASREVAEEAGLVRAPITAILGSRDTIMPLGKAALIAPTTVFSRPDPGSFDWVQMKPGAWVETLRNQSGYTQIRYIEPDQLPDPNYNTYEIVGWVPDEVLASIQRRWFFRFEWSEPTPPSWKVNADNHTFTLEWFPMNELPELISPQDAWLEVLLEHLGK